MRETFGGVRVIYVITENHSKFRGFCTDAKIPVRNGNFVYLDRVEKLRGTLHVPIILYATYWLHPDWDRMIDILETRNPVYLGFKKAEGQR